MNPFRQLAEESYSLFAGKPGNQHIASVHALEGVLRLLAHQRAQHVLEVGLGIGSISYTVLAAKEQGLLSQSLSYQGTEINDFCLSQLPLNLGHYFQQSHIAQDITDLPSEAHFDFVIVDGKAEKFAALVALADTRATFFIEGDRADQVFLLRQSFTDRHVYYRDISMRKNPACGPFDANSWAGGFGVIFVSPTIRQQSSCLISRVQTGIKYRLRRAVND